MTFKGIYANKSWTYGVLLASTILLAFVFLANMIDMQTLHEFSSKNTNQEELPQTRSSSDEVTARLQSEDLTGVRFTHDLEPQCTEIGDTGSCWRALVNHPDCHVWDDHPLPKKTITFEGVANCLNGLLAGTGIETWRWNDTEIGWIRSTREGRYVDGKRGDDWVWEYTNGQRHVGPYIEGKRHGHWVLRAEYRSEEGPFNRGKRHGYWVGQQPGENFGILGDDEMKDHWVEVPGEDSGNESTRIDSRKRDARLFVQMNGTRCERAYNQGKRHGHWVTQWRSGKREEGHYIKGEPQGNFVHIEADGTRCEGLYKQQNVLTGRWACD